jgi:uncharacterized DUF497 family protein
MRFEWDDAKNRANQRKHHLSFETARQVFDDPLHVSRLERGVEGEQRWLTLGLVAGLALLIVSHTYSDDEGEELIRIISARKASRRERREYENG